MSSEEMSDSRLDPVRGRQFISGLREASSAPSGVVQDEPVTQLMATASKPTRRFSDGHCRHRRRRNELPTPFFLVKTSTSGGGGGGEGRGTDIRKKLLT